jgi:site-specific DNA-methyltransferase (adenine-specific)
MMDWLNTVHLGDCLTIMPLIPDKSMNMILCDLPYGATECKWDAIIPFEPLWEQYKRIIKDNGAIVLTGIEPFSSRLRLSNIDNYKYDWKWEKSKATGFLDARRKPLNNYEDVCVFYKKQPTYNPQMEKATKIYKRGFNKSNKSECYGKQNQYIQEDCGYRFPKRIIKIGNADTRNILHPTQKPVALFEYLIKTYTNQGEIVLDNCAGSGTTAAACINTNRNYVLIEKEVKYYDIILKRIKTNYDINVFFADC